jgi:hypothetical protein
MPGSPDDLDDAAAQPVNVELPDPQPVRHGQVSVHSSHPNRNALVGQMQRHLAEHVQHLNATKQYHGGQSSEGGFTGSGMSDSAGFDDPDAANYGSVDDKAD